MNNEATNTAATVAERGAHVPSEKTSAKKTASQRKGAPGVKKTARGAKAKAAAAKKTAKVSAKSSRKAAKTERNASIPRLESKGAKILQMIARATGVTLAEIMKATEWQAHSVRGFISAAAKKHGLKITSMKDESGERTYKIGK
jgi:hypothetical protein